jgi:hypothetical protein
LFQRTIGYRDQCGLGAEEDCVVGDRRGGKALGVERVRGEELEDRAGLNDVNNAFFGDEVNFVGRGDGRGGEPGFAVGEPGSIDIATP